MIKINIQIDGDNVSVKQISSTEKEKCYFVILASYDFGDFPVFIAEDLQTALLKLEQLKKDKDDDIAFNGYRLYYKCKESYYLYQQNEVE